MLLGGDAQIDQYSPTSNGNLSSENDTMNMSNNGTPENNSSSPFDQSLSNVNMLNSPTATAPQSIQTLNNDDYKSKDNNQNFLPENNIDLYQQQPSHPHATSAHVSPRVQPYDLNIAHQQVHHHLRSNSHMNQYNVNGNGNGNSNNNNNNNINNNSSSNGRKLSSPYKNHGMINNHQTSMFEGLVSSSSGSEMMILKEEPESGY
jgi:hypothetical protein